MVGRFAALLALALALATPAPAQEGTRPPAAAVEAPALPSPSGGAGEPLPALPPAVAPLALPDGAGVTATPAPSPAPSDASGADGVDTDLAALVLKAHPVVQAVMGLLAAAVFAVLTIFLFKAVEFALAFARLSREARALAASPGLPAAEGTGPHPGPLAQALRAARDEAEALPRPLTPDLRAAARERLDLSLARIEAAALRRLRSGTGLLATIGSVAPFVGLFGTVFGIMNSFLAIAATRTTNLAVVAPGIAEALLATGIGLAAAIPAVMLYNRALRRIAEFRHHLADGTAEILRRFSRACDARMGGGT
jgi:biopolymer transport protein ExbB